MQAMKAQWGVEIQTHTLNLSNKWRGSGQVHFLAALPPGKSPSTHRIQCRMGPQTLPGLWRKGKTLVLVNNQTKIPQSSSPNPSQNTNYATLTPSHCHRFKYLSNNEKKFLTNGSTARVHRIQLSSAIFWISQRRSMIRNSQKEILASWDRIGTQFGWRCTKRNKQLLHFFLTFCWPCIMQWFLVIVQLDAQILFNVFIYL